MSAKLDRSQTVRFYYGNAARDLSDFLPAEDEFDFAAAAVPSFVESSPEPQIHSHVDFMSDAALAVPETAQELVALNESLDRSMKMMESIQLKRRELGFLIADLKRMLA